MVTNVYLCKIIIYLCLYMYTNLIVNYEINGIKPQGRTLNPCFRSRTPRNRVYELGVDNSIKLLVRRSSDSYRSE